MPAQTARLLRLSARRMHCWKQMVCTFPMQEPASHRCEEYVPPCPLAKRGAPGERRGSGLAGEKGERGGVCEKGSLLQGSRNGA